MPSRRESGSRGAKIFRDEKDPNNVAVHFVWDKMNRARTFFEFGFMIHQAKCSGVIGTTEIFFEVEKAYA
jgi:hypothetical protein